MIHFNSAINKWQFDLSNHNANRNSKRQLLYNQLFVEDRLYLLNTDTGNLYTNQVDLDKVDLLKQYNFCLKSCKGIFGTTINTKTIYKHELIYEIKTNANWVINHIDGNPTNNKLSNLELITNWFNTKLQKKNSSLPMGINYDNINSYVSSICLPCTKRSVSFTSKSIDYLQNIQYQFGTKSKLVSPKRYLQETPNWLPDNTIAFTTAHQQKLDMLITAHLENQSRWSEIPMLVLN